VIVQGAEHDGKKGVPVVMEFNNHLNEIANFIQE
jgi:hypothetical protein